MNHGNVLHEAQLFYVQGFDVFTLEYRGLVYRELYLRCAYLISYFQLWQ